jgi:hypothetical protein
LLLHHTRGTWTMHMSLLYSTNVWSSNPAKINFNLKYKVIGLATWTTKF